MEDGLASRWNWPDGDTGDGSEFIGVCACRSQGRAAGNVPWISLLLERLCVLRWNFQHDVQPLALGRFALDIDRVDRFAGLGHLPEPGTENLEKIDHRGDGDLGGDHVCDVVVLSHPTDLDVAAVTRPPALLPVRIVAV